MPYGPPSIPPGRRMDMPYPPSPHNMRAQPPYPGYHYPPMSGPPLPQHYHPQHYQPQWNPYQQMQPPPPPPPMHQHQPQQQQHQHQRQYPQSYSPLVVSSYPQPQQSAPPPHVPPPSLPSQSQPSQTTITPLLSPFSPPPPSSTPGSSSANAQVTPSPTVSNVTDAPPPALTKDFFFAPLPWLSVSEGSFPQRAARRRRRKPRAEQSLAEPVVFPSREIQAATEVEQPVEEVENSVPTPVQTPTPEPSQAASETDSTQPTTPSSTVTPQAVARIQQTPTQSKSHRAIVPVVPVVPIMSPTTPKRPHRDSAVSTALPTRASDDDGNQQPSAASVPVVDEGSPAASDETSKLSSVIPAAPKSWADLVRAKAAPSSANITNSATAQVNGHGPAKNETLSDVLNTMSTDFGQNSSKIAFVEPRGLVNTGNMCYMNSVLQVLVFCVPFYEFLDRVGRRAAHSFKSDTPLVDSMIMFMREFSIIDSADSVEQLKLRLKQSELEQYGEPFIPEYVYSVIKGLNRFKDMKRGHQQDVQEFLGFLLEELHEECARALRSTTFSADSEASTPTGSNSNASELPAADSGWLEVGHRQKAAITRSSGAITTESPITKIFGGKLRSEFKVPGNKNSVTLEPYQPLQLDIGSPQINNIVDALKGLTRPESMQGDFNSARGPNVTATKQVFIETLPPVLILHLKRFQYENSTKGTQKIWKKIGYPLELEIPKEVFAPQKRNQFNAHGGLPKYKLISVIYHHGKNASGGHYTVDVRRQDGGEWIRLDDTIIRRVRSEDVAEGGSEEDPKILAAALEQHKQQKSSNANMFEHIDQDESEQADSEKGWSQVNGHGAGGHSSKKSLSATNGTATPAKDVSGGQTPSGRYSVKDNKVAYLLFYQRIPA